MSWFKRTKTGRPAPPAGSEAAQFLIPNDVTWTVEDISKLEQDNEWKEALVRWRRLLEPYLDPAFKDQIAAMRAHRIIWQHIGWCCRYLSRLDEARSAFENAESLARAAGDTAVLADVLRGLGVTHRSLGDTAHALGYLALALEAAKAANARRLQVSIHEDIALCHAVEGRMDRALAEAKVAYALHFGTSGSDPEIETHLLSNVGVVLLERGREKEARSAFERALVKARETGNAEQEAFIRSNLAVVH